MNVNASKVINYLKPSCAVSDQNVKLTITLSVQGHTLVQAADSDMGSSNLNTSLVCQGMFSGLFLQCDPQKIQIKTKSHRIA